MFEFQSNLFVKSCINKTRILYLQSQASDTWMSLHISRHVVGNTDEFCGTGEYKMIWFYKQIHLFATAYAERIRPELFCLFPVPANWKSLKVSNPRSMDQLLNPEVKTVFH